MKQLVSRFIFSLVGILFFTISYGQMTPFSLAYEAEDGVLAGLAELGTGCINASGGDFVKLFNDNSNSLTLSGLNVPATGDYKLSIAHFNENATKLTLKVNDGLEQVLNIPSAQWCYQGAPSVYILTVNLTAGDNTLRFGVSNGESAPFMDYIVIEELTPIQVSFNPGNIRFLENGTTEIKLEFEDPLFSDESLELQISGFSGSEMTIVPASLSLISGTTSASFFLTNTAQQGQGKISIVNTSPGIVSDGADLQIIISSEPQKYFVSESGDDANVGNSEQAPWQSLARISKGSFMAGDSILFKSGEVFDGRLIVTSSGSSTDPIYYGAYGVGDKPLINGSDAELGGFEEAVLVLNKSHILMEGLKITNERLTTQSGTRQDVGFGIYVHNDGDESMYGLTFRDLYIHEVYANDLGPNVDFNSILVAGIFIETERNTVAGKEKNIQDVVVEDCYVTRTGKFGVWARHRNADTGIGTELTNMNLNFILRNNHFFETGGSGITLSRVYNGLVENNIFEFTGSNADPRMAARGSGSWYFTCTNIVAQYNKSLHIRGPGDSYGMHIDYGNKYVIFQYNYSEDSEGGFVEVLGDNTDVAYRFNISVNDGLRSTAKILWVSPYAGTNRDILSDNVFIYNNSAYVAGSLTPDISIESKKTYVYNNIFQVGGIAQIGQSTSFQATPGDAIKLYNNAYFGNISNAFKTKDTSPKNVDPKFVGPGSTNADGYKLNTSSTLLTGGVHSLEPSFPMAGQGIFKDITAKATKDFFGNSIDDQYALSYGAFNGAGDQIQVLAVNRTQNGVNVFPNPTEGAFQISSELNIKSVRIFDLGGRLLRSFGSELKIDLGQIKSGIYLVDVLDDREQVHTFRIFKK